MAETADLRFTIPVEVADAFCQQMSLENEEGEEKSNAQLMWDHIADEWRRVAIYIAGENAAKGVTGTSVTLGDKMETAKEAAEELADERLEITGETIAAEIIR